MAIGGILLGFILALLYCAIVILVAYVFVWGLSVVLGIVIDGNVMKFGKIVIGLICLYILLAWLLGALGVALPISPFPRLR